MTQERQAQQAALDASIARGLADAEAGRTAPAEDVFARIETKYRRMIHEDKKLDSGSSPE